MEIWLRELPDVMLLQFYHRIPLNTTYWTGWPSKEDPYMNEAFWHRTFINILTRLKQRRSSDEDGTETSDRRPGYRAARCTDSHARDCLDPALCAARSSSGRSVGSQRGTFPISTGDRLPVQTPS